MVGRKRHLLVDTDGRVIELWVHDADIQDPDGGCDVLRCAKAEHPTLELVFADSRYAGSFVEWAQEQLGIVVEVVHNADLSRKVARMRPIGLIKG